jgi:hypothetical protein
MARRACGEQEDPPHVGVQPKCGHAKENAVGADQRQYQRNDGFDVGQDRRANASVAADKESRHHCLDDGERRHDLTLVERGGVAH